MGSTTRDEQGQATVELALCLPILALLLAAIVEIGVLVGDQARVWHAAREAVRVATVDRDVDDIREAAAAVGLRDIEVAVQPDAGNRIQGEPVSVSVTYDPPGHVPLLGDLLSRAELHAEATMRIETP
jgi:Flp pilus assembly pilin Flp